MKILAVDDEKYALKFLSETLKEVQPDAEIISFDRSDKALELIKTGALFDAAFLDISMPVINGVDLAKELKKFNPLINIVFCTAYN